MKGLVEECEYEQAQGRITLVDGSRIVCPSPHAALNYKLQGGGARVMALGAVILQTSIARNKLDSRSEEHTSELQSLMRISYAAFCLKKKIRNYVLHV